MVRGRVYRSSQREFFCKIDGAKDLVTATALGKLLKGRDNQIVVGDFVQLQQDKNGYQIMNVEDRTSEVFRVIVREAQKKVTAANIDLLVVTSSVSMPVYKRGIVDRFLVRSYQWNIRPIVVFNKMDEYNSEILNLSFEADRLKSLEVDSFEVSAMDNAYKAVHLNRGITELRDCLRGKTALFLGQSGVGKSALISALAGGKVDLTTGEVGKKGKGTHTTSWSEIVDVGDFLLVDSPGIRSLSLEDLPSEDFISYFPDLADLAVKCRYINCDHSDKSTGCAFGSLDPDEYQTKLILSRLESYLRIYGELSQIPQWANRIVKKKDT